MKDKKLVIDSVVDGIIDSDLSKWKSELNDFIMSHVRKINLSEGFNSKECVDFIYNNCIFKTEVLDYYKKHLIKKYFLEMQRRSELYEAFLGANKDFES